MARLSFNEIESAKKEQVAYSKKVKNIKTKQKRQFRNE